MKILNNKMVWRYGGEGATHKVWPGSMQQFPRNLNLWTTGGRGGRTTDACAMIAVPLTKGEPFLYLPEAKDGLLCAFLGLF